MDKDFPDMPPIAFNYTGDAAANNIAYQYPTVGTKALMVKYGEEVEIVFQGTNVGGAENHPMHLHGYSFYLVGTGYGNWVDNSTVKYNMDDPPEINTVGVPKNGWAVIRFKADNPGTLSIYLFCLYLPLFICVCVCVWIVNDMHGDAFQGFGLCTAIWNGMRVGVWTLFSLWRMGPAAARTKGFG